MEATIYELLQSQRNACTHIVPTEVVRDSRGDFLLMPCFVGLHVQPPPWSLEQVLNYFVQVLEVRLSFAVA